MIEIGTHSVDLGSKNKVALKLLGGGIPNVPFQMGVVKALTDWRFRVRTGCKDEDESREFGPDVLNPIIGSSSGSFAAIAAAMGYGYEDLMGISGRIKPISESIIRDPIETGLIGLLKRLFTSRRKYTRLKNLVKSEPSVYEHLINTYYPIWTMDALEEYLREELLGGCDFGSLRTKVLVLAVTLEQRMTLILGDECRPRKAHDDFKFQDGIPIWKAAAGSMSLPPYYEPYELEDPPREIAPADGESIVLIDGETRDAFSTDAAEDSGADLIIVSSFYRVHEYTEGLGHISDYGTMPVMWQERAQGKDARKHLSIEHRNQKQKVLELYREQLEESCVTQKEIEENMEQMESAIDFREELDVIEIQAQDYVHEDLTYPYWDPFTLKEDIVEFLYESGYEVAQEALEERLETPVN